MNVIEEIFEKTGPSPLQQDYQAVCHYVPRRRPNPFEPSRTTVLPRFSTLERRWHVLFFLTSKAVMYMKNKPHKFLLTKNEAKLPLYY